MGIKIQPKQKMITGTPARTIDEIVKDINEKMYS